MGYDNLKHIAGSIEVSQNLRSLDLSQNNLKNSGCLEIAKILKRNTSLQKINLNKNDIREEGLVKILQSLKENKYLLTIKLEGNIFGITRGILAIIGSLLTQENNTLQVMLLTGSKQTLLSQELADGEAFDSIMIT